LIGLSLPNAPGNPLVNAGNCAAIIAANVALPPAGHSLNWWVGLGMMHILWAKEHNYVCDMLMQNITNITWTDNLRPVVNSVDHEG
jgi:hypothetical protein